MLEMINVTKQFKKRNGVVTAVHDVSLSIGEDEIFALVGESGSGKSTLAEIVTGLQEPTRGAIVRCDHACSPLKMQLIFQNPDRSLNPYWKVKEIVAEPLVLRKVPRSEAYEQVAELIERVKLPQTLLERYPSECSGGQKQRVAIARALSTSPKLLVADEITSSLDPPTEVQILQLLLSLKCQNRMSILYITHRLETIVGFADRIAVMQRGVIVELGSVEQVLTVPQSEYTKKLLNACLYSVAR